MANLYTCQIDNNSYFLNILNRANAWITNGNITTSFGETTYSNYAIGDGSYKCDWFIAQFVASTSNSSQNFYVICKDGGSAQAMYSAPSYTYRRPFSISSTTSGSTTSYTVSFDDCHRVGSTSTAQNSYLIFYRLYVLKDFGTGYTQKTSVRDITTMSIDGVKYRFNRITNPTLLKGGIEEDTQSSGDSLLPVTTYFKDIEWFLLEFHASNANSTSFFYLVPAQDIDGNYSTTQYVHAIYAAPSYIYGRHLSIRYTNAGSAHDLTIGFYNTRRVDASTSNTYNTYLLLANIYALNYSTYMNGVE